MKRKASSPTRDVVRLADLTPRHRITGGSERRVFGSDPAAWHETTTERGKKAPIDLPAGKNVTGRAAR